MNPKKKSRCCLGLNSGLDLAISRFIYSFAAAASRVRFAPEQPAEPRREPFSPGRQGFLKAPPLFLTLPPLGPPTTAKRRPD